jgi:hypothetical protein
MMVEARQKTASERGASAFYCETTRRVKSLSPKDCLLILFAAY